MIDHLTDFCKFSHRFDLMEKNMLQGKKVLLLLRQAVQFGIRCLVEWPMLLNDINHIAKRLYFHHHPPFFLVRKNKYAC